ncbi:MAG: hypothetical protein IJT75_04480 [Bacteroidaceae bacterium]|nr:hypothetical protein [Bacteroidaceae bacterium]
MKRTFTQRCLAIAITALMATASFAQSAYFTYNGTRLADGATVTIEAEEDGWGGYACETNPSGNLTGGLMLVNATGSKLSGTATLTITKDNLKPYQILWCMGGTCVNVKSTPYNKDYAVPAKGSIPVQYDAVLDEDNLQYGEMDATIVAKVGAETFTVKVVFTYTDPARVSAAAQQPVVLEYFTLDGKSCKLQQPKGVSLARFSDGKVRKVIKK